MRVLSRSREIAVGNDPRAALTSDIFEPDPRKALVHFRRGIRLHDARLGEDLDRPFQVPFLARVLDLRSVVVPLPGVVRFLRGHDLRTAKDRAVLVCDLDVGERVIDAGTVRDIPAIGFAWICCASLKAHASAPHGKAGESSGSSGSIALVPNSSRSLLSLSASFSPAVWLRRLGRAGLVAASSFDIRLAPKIR